MAAYYNEIDPYAAEWLRNLIRDGHIADGEVDTRSIEDVQPDDLRRFTQCHFFAGVGLWSYALRRAGWSDDRRIWTASCPCQPFSAAGKGVGFDDERHLWPAFHYLASVCRPSVVCGEQVASKDGLAWLDLVQTDLEGLGYAVWPVVFPAASVGAPNERHRLYWVGLGDTDCDRRETDVSRDERGEARAGSEGRAGANRSSGADGLDYAAGARLGGRALGDAESDSRHEARLRLPSPASGFSGVADSDDGERERRECLSRRDVADGADAGRSENSGHAAAYGANGGVADSQGAKRLAGNSWAGRTRFADGDDHARALDNAERARPQGFAGHGDDAARREIANRPTAARSVLDGMGDADGEPTGGHTGTIPRAQATVECEREHAARGFDNRFADASAGVRGMGDAGSVGPGTLAGSAGAHAGAPGEIGPVDPAALPERSSQIGGVADSSSRGFGIGGGAEFEGRVGHTDGGFPTSGVADSHGGQPGDAGILGGGEYGLEPQNDSYVRCADCGGWHRDAARMGPGPLNGFWRDADWLFCTDGRWRPVEPGTFPLAYGLPRGMGTIGAGLAGLYAAAGVGKRELDAAKRYRVGSLRAFGNAINPVQAAEFIAAWEPLAP